MEQKKVQLLLLQLAACLLKAFFMHNNQREMRSKVQIFNLSWNDTQDWIYDSRYCILNVAKKVKNKFLKSIYFCLGKVWPMQTSNLAICLGIHLGICCIPTRIARVVKETSCWSVFLLINSFHILKYIWKCHISFNILKRKNLLSM